MVYASFFVVVVGLAFVVVPAAVSGIIAALLLGVSRAIGETMVVAIAAGGTPPTVA